MILGAKARALLHGRVSGWADDVRAVARPVMRHRLFTNFTADAEGVTPCDIIDMLIEAVTEPSAEDYKSTSADGS